MLLKSVSMPFQILMAPKWASMAIGLIAVILWVFMEGPILTILSALGLWFMTIAYSFKDPHFMEVFYAKTLYSRKTRNLHLYKGKRYYAG